MAASCNITLPGCKLFHKWEIIVHNSAMLQVLALGIEVWKHLLGYKKDNTFVYVFFTATFSNTTSPRGLPSSNHNCSSTIFTFTWPRLGQGNLAPRTIYTVPCLWMDLVILIFFCAYALCLHCEDSGKEREREGKKTSLTEAQSIISQVFDWSDCKRSRQFPRALDWDELELVRNKTQFSRSEETAVLNKTRQRMQKKRLPALDKVESWLLFFLLPPFPCRTQPII